MYPRTFVLHAGRAPVTDAVFVCRGLCGVSLLGPCHLPPWVNPCCPDSAFFMFLGRFEAAASILLPVLPLLTWR